MKLVICLLSVSLVLSLVVRAVWAESFDERKARILKPTTVFSEAEQFEQFQGGSGTNRSQIDKDAFSQPAQNLTFEQRSDFFVGNGIFDRPWVPAPASTQSSDGLGPLFNARSCQGCHIKDGRGHPPEEGDVNFVSMLFTLSDPHGEPDPIYGAQLQDQGIVGQKREGRPNVIWKEETFTYPDGTLTSLRRPTFEAQDLNYGPLGTNTALGPRIAPQMIGLGLLEAIAEADIQAQADPEDLDGDGISGWSPLVFSEAQNELVYGRFGWKALKATLADQNAQAFSSDMGLSTTLKPVPWGECTATQTDCLNAPHGITDANVEIVDQLFELLTFYTQTLAVPTRQNWDEPRVLAGKKVFYQAGCTSCHTPKFATARGDDVAKEVRGQLIWPYTDLLLHDMGEDLADPNPIGRIAGYEWRTPPLWGIGYTAVVSGHTYFLHDGRARSLEEAILWHGGEAQESRDNFVQSTGEDRSNLLSFLGSL